MDAAPAAAATSLDGGWLCDLPVTAPSGQLLRVALTLQDAQRAVCDVKQCLLAQHGDEQATTPAMALQLVEQAAHKKLGLGGARPTGDVVDRELSDTMRVNELRQRVDQGAVLYLQVSPPHAWRPKEQNEGTPHPPPRKFALQPPSDGRRYVCISSTGKANVRPTASLRGRVLREIHPGDTVVVFEEKMYDGHLRGRISPQADESSGQTVWLSIRTRFGNPLMQTASLQEQEESLELVAGLVNRGHTPAAAAGAALGAEPQGGMTGAAVDAAAGGGAADLEFELEFDDDDDDGDMVLG